MGNIRRGLESLGHVVHVLAQEPETNRLVCSDAGPAVPHGWLVEQTEVQLAEFYRRRLGLTEPFIMRREAERYAFEMALSLFPLNQYDIVQAHDVIASRALSRMLPRTTPLIARFGGWLAREMVAYGMTGGSALGERYLALEERLGLAATPHRFVPSHWLKQVFVRDYGIKPDGIRVVHSGVDVEDVLQRARQAPTEVAPVDGQRVILCPARLAPYKGHTVLFEALAKLLSRQRDFVCWLAGDGGMRAKLEAYAKELGLQNHVFFLGTRRDLPALMSISDVVVLPSLLDSLPFAVQEAQVIGKPVVAFRTCGLPEMIRDGETGLLVEPQNTDALSDRLERLLASTSLRETLGGQAAAWGREHWDVRRMTRETLEIYQQAVEADRLTLPLLGK